MPRFGRILSTAVVSARLLRIRSPSVTCDNRQVSVLLAPPGARFKIQIQGPAAGAGCAGECADERFKFRAKYRYSYGTVAR